jgi:hypothetical protein
MESDNSLLSVSHATSMPQRLRLYRWLCLVLLVVVLLAAGSTVSAPVAPPEVVRGTRLEIVNDAGQVVLRAEAQQAGGVLQLWSAQGTLSLALRAPPLGGRLEILNAAEQTVFSVGQTPTSEVPGHWEQHLRVVEGQRRELTQQQQELANLGRRVSALEQLDRAGTTGERQLRTAEDLRRELDQQRRDLDQQRRLIEAVERQLRVLERR